MNNSQREAIQRVAPEYSIEISEQDNHSDPENVEVVLLSENKWLTSDKLARMKNLKLIQTLWAGVDSVNFELIPDGVTICGNVGGFSEPIAEHVFGLIICLARNLLIHDRDLKQGNFDRSKMGIFLKGKKICVLGTGGIGQAVAKLAQAFGMITLGINTSGSKALNFERTGSLSEIDSFLKETNVVVIALPLTVHTRGLFDERRLNLLEPNCIVVNVGRGRVVDQKALYDYLLTHPTVKFGTDVWWEYPKKGEKFSQHFPFFDLPNFMGSPHDANDVPESDEMAMNNAIQNISRYFKNESLRGVAKKEEYLALKNS